MMLNIVSFKGNKSIIKQCFTPHKKIYYNTVEKKYIDIYKNNIQMQTEITTKIKEKKKKKFL